MIDPTRASGHPAAPQQRRVENRRATTLLLIGAVLSGALLLSPPDGLTPAGWASLLVMLTAVALWSIDLLPTGATALLSMLLLVVTGAVGDLPSALVGLSRPTVIFLLGVLAMGLATYRSGLADRAAAVLLALARGRGPALYVQMVASFAVLAFLLPSASTRGAILLPVYEQALDRLAAAPGGPLRQAIMLGLASLNRLGSNALLTGGITPVVAAALIGGFTWTSWLVYMGVPVYALLLVGALTVFLLTRPQREALPPSSWSLPDQPLSAAERRMLLISLVVSLLWMTDFIHHWDPALPAILGGLAVVAPGIGVVTWQQLEVGLGWANLLVIAASLSLAQAMGSSGAAAWLAGWLLRGADPLLGEPLALAACLVVVCLVLRAVLPNISAYLTLLIPLVMGLAPALGLNPLVCGMIVTVAGDSVLYYPAQSSSSLLVAERGHLSAGPVVRLAGLMAGLVMLVLLLLALPYWAALGQPLAAP